MPSFLFAILFVLASPSMGQVDPQVEWKKIDLPQFEIIFDSQQQELAELYIARLTGVLQNLSPLFSDIPEKTTIVLSDRTDLTNGSATPFPYPLIIIYPVLPSPGDSINEFADWPSEILTHEYAHILAMHPRRGVVKGLQKIFGSIMVPNLLLPRWWHEGLAVEMETRYSAAGRLRSQLQDSWLRSYQVDGTFAEINLAEANELSHPTWPYGARPYVFGSILWSELISEYGSDIVKKLSSRYGGRVPFLIETPLHDEIDVEYPQYFEKAKTRLGERIKKQILRLSEVSPTQGQTVSLPYMEVFSPRISPDGLKLAFISKDETNKRSIQILQRSTLQEPFSERSLRFDGGAGEGEVPVEMKAPIPRMSDAPPGGSISGISWFPNSEKLVYAKLDAPNRFHEVSDLWTYDLKNGISEQLSINLRAREPKLSFDGKKIAYVSIQPGKTDLAIFDILSKSTKIIFSAPLLSRVSSPVFISDDEIIFSLREKQRENLKKIKISSGVLSDIACKNCYALRGLSKDRYILSSGANGVTNIYDSQNGKIRPLTHSLTSVYDADFDEHLQDLYYTEQTSQGLQLKRSPYKITEKLPLQLPNVESLYADRYPPVKTSEIASSKLAGENYSVSPYLLPRYWLPTFYWDSYSSYLSLMTSANDPLMKHAWTLYGNYDLQTQRLGYNFTYNNNTTAVEFLTNAIDQTVLFPGNIFLKTQMLFLAAGFELPWFRGWTGSFGWTSLSRSDSLTTSLQIGPSMTFAYSDYEQSGAQISPESGEGGSIRASSYLAGPNQTSFNQLEIAYLQFFSSFLPKRHVLMAKIQGGYIDHNVSSVNYFYTSSQSQAADDNRPNYLIRGFANGAFQGRSLLQPTLEYRFPLKGIYSGWGTTPFFVRRLYGAVVVDGVAVDGFAYDSVFKFYRSVRIERSFWSAGLEAKLDVTVGYHFPMTFYVGVYSPLDNSLTSSSQFAIGLFL
jgi:hypothetical protein